MTFITAILAVFVSSIQNRDAVLHNILGPRAGRREVLVTPEVESAVQLENASRYNQGG